MARKVLLLLLLLPFVCSEGLAQSRIFWADAQHPKIRSVHVDGSNVATVKETTLPTGMTVDTRHGWIYYLSFPLGHGVYGELRRLPIAGGSEEILLETGWTEGGLAIDYEDGKIYWATRLRDMNRITIMRANLDGTQVEEVAHEASSYCKGIAVDPVGGYVYWTTGETILRARLDAGVEDVGPDPTLPPYPSFGGGISIDAQARKMYWTRRGNRSSSGWIGIFRANLDGSNLEKLWEDTYADAGDIVVDGASKYVYWTQWSAFLDPDGVLIRRARIDEPISWENIEDIVKPPDTPTDLTKGLALFLDPGAPVLESPADKAQGVATTTELRWHSVECSRYDVQVASDSSFAQIVYRENTPHPSTTFVAPVAQNRYWWRIHSNPCGIASRWSDPWSFDVGDSGSLTPLLAAPEEGEHTGLDVTFSWIPGPEAVFHRFQLATESNFAPTLISTDSLSTSEVTVNDLDPGQTYFWRVAGFDTTGNYTFAAARTFSVAALPAVVELVTPTDGQTEVPAYATFEWKEAEGADSYHFELSATTDFASIVVDENTESTSFQLTGPLAYAAEHHWRVCGVNVAGEGPWTLRSFTVAVGTAVEPTEGIPQATSLGDVYPNPAAQAIHMPFDLAQTGHTRIDVYDLFGRRVTTLMDEDAAAGRYNRSFGVDRLASGTYFAVLTVDASQSRAVFTVVR